MRRFETILLAAGLTMVSATALLAADAAPNAPARLEMTSDGPVLVAANGMTLYVNGADRNGQSSCTNVIPGPPAGRQGAAAAAAPPREAPRSWNVKSCLDKWKPYVADASIQPAGDFATITRGDGVKQWTWKGKPLYFSFKDEKPGDRWGSSFAFTSAYQLPGTGGGRGGAQMGGGGGGFRYATVPFEFPPTVRLARFENDLVVSAANGRPLYTLKKGATLKPGDDMLTPVLSSELSKVSGDWSIADVGDGRKQYAFKGKPLYSLPEEVHVNDVDEAGIWEQVVFEKGAGKPPQIETRYSYAGEVYATKEGLTLYQFNCGGGRGGGGGGVGCEDPGDHAGYWVAICGSGEECARRWRPYLATADAKSQGEWSVVEVAHPLFTDPRGTTYPPEAPRVKAWAYRGKAVFTYYEDTAPGDIWGQNIRWFFGGSSMTALSVAGRGEGRGG